MKTVFNSLTFYDSVDKRDVDRTRAVIPVHCPRHQLPPFIINLGSDTIGTIDKIELLSDESYNDAITGTSLVNYSGGVYTAFDTLTGTASQITMATATTPGSYLCYITLGRNLKEGEVINVAFDLTIYAGIGPVVFIGSAGQTAKLILSNYETALAASNEFNFHVLKDCSNAALYFYSVFAAGTAQWSTGAITISKGDITSLFQSVPAQYTDASLGNYIQYKGSTLIKTLPLGLWYLKITAPVDAGNGNAVYYSDYIMIDDIYQNLISTFYDSSTISDGHSALYFSTSVAAYTYSNTFSVRQGEVLTLRFNFIGDGETPLVSLRNGTTVIGTDTPTISAGLNVITITSNIATSLAIIRFDNTTTADWLITNIYLFRKYSPKFCKIKFTNTNNVGNLLYADDFYQEVWLESILNNPSHEIAETGEEKDGVFIPEKIVSKYIYSIIAYVSRAMYSCLSRLRQHDTITITDECGDEYTPGEGNVTVEQPEWTFYDTAKVTIRFNNDSDSQYVWTK